MNKLECEIVSITGDHNRIILESTQPVPFGLVLDEIEHRIVQAYMQPAVRLRQEEFEFCHGRRARIRRISPCGLTSFQGPSSPIMN